MLDRYSNAHGTSRHGESWICSPLPLCIRANDAWCWRQFRQLEFRASESRAPSSRGPTVAIQSILFSILFPFLFPFAALLQRLFENIPSWNKYCYYFIDCVFTGRWKWEKKYNDCVMCDEWWLMTLMIVMSLKLKLAIRRNWNETPETKHVGLFFVYVFFRTPLITLFVSKMV